MADVSYVLPDSILGGPGEREGMALRSGCDIVEIGSGDAPPPSLPWLLRTASIDDDGRDRPRWHDRAWTRAFVAEVAVPAVNPPAAVVIDPGDEWTLPHHLARALREIRNGYAGSCGRAPAILVGNRAEQSIPDGETLAEFWGYLSREAPTLVPHVGIALDAPELYAATKSRMGTDLSVVPLDALRYVRIHAHGRKPDLGDPLPWRSVFGLIRHARGPVWIAPAVHEPEALEPTILFCMLSLQSRAFT